MPWVKTAATWYVSGVWLVDRRAAAYLAKLTARPRLLGKPKCPKASLPELEPDFELVQLSCALAELGVGRPFADAGQGPADGFRPACHDARADQRV
jgi:hypothetical protein